MKIVISGVMTWVLLYFFFIFNQTLIDIWVSRFFLDFKCHANATLSKLSWDLICTCFMS